MSKILVFGRDEQAASKWAFANVGAKAPFEIVNLARWKKDSGIPRCTSVVILGHSQDLEALCKRADIGVDVIDQGDAPAPVKAAAQAAPAPAATQAAPPAATTANPAEDAKVKADEIRAELKELGVKPAPNMTLENLQKLLTETKGA